MARSPIPSTIEMRLEARFVEVDQMRVVCAWCGVVLSGERGPVSHGICASCSLTVERAYLLSLARRQEKPKRRQRRPLPGLPLPGFFAEPAIAGR